MAVDYTTLFARIGKIIKWTNKFLTLQGTTDTSAILYSGNEVQATYTGAGAERYDLLGSTEQSYLGFSQGVKSWITLLVDLASTTLGDLQQELNAPSDDINTILPLLYDRMVTDSKTVDASAITTPSISAGGSNLGSGSLIASKVNIKAVDDERSISEVMVFRCISDQFNGGTAGGEVFVASGYPKFEATDYRTRGNGSGFSIACANESGNNKIVNGNFDAFTSDAPDSWDIDAGAATTNFLEETTVVHPETGGSAFKLDGDGSTATVTISQNLQLAVTPLARYAVACFARKGGTVSAGSNLQISIKGTGFTTVNLFNADPTTLTTGYVMKKGGSDGFFTSPADIPTDFRVEITWTSANTAGATALIYIDDLALVQSTEIGHTHYALFRGAADFIVADLFNSTTVNDYAGTIQTWFGRFYDFQLPSNAAGGENILDSVAI